MRSAAVRVRINSKPFGETEIDEKQIFDFEDGILGFDFVKQFAILDSADNSPFKWMQACDAPDLAFVIIQPVDFMAQYELVIAQSDLELVGARSPEELIVFAIVTIPSEPSNMTANLQGPVILNPSRQKGRQVISLSDKYRVKHRILDEIKKSAGKEA
jgi:flagellar assembly factor FliW